MKGRKPNVKKDMKVKKYREFHKLPWRDIALLLEEDVKNTFSRYKRVVGTYPQPEKKEA